VLSNNADLRNTKFHNALMLYAVFFTQEHATEKPPDLHQWVHQRLRMTMDILGREPEDEPRPQTMGRECRSAACDYGTKRLLSYSICLWPVG